MKILAILMLLFFSFRAYPENFWLQVNFPDTLVCTSINAQKDGILYAAANYNTQHCLLRSIDNGETWQFLIPLSQDSPDINTIMVSSQEDIFIGSSTGIFKSDDNGITFIKVTDTAAHIMNIKETNNHILFASAWRQILKSVDNGNTWEPILTLEGYQLFWDVDFGPNNEIYGSAIIGSFEDYGLYRSFNNGYTWQDPCFHSESIYDIEVNDNGTIFANGYNNFAYISSDRGNNWEITDCGQITSLFSDQHDILYAGVHEQDNRNFFKFSTDWGLTWNYSDSTINIFINQISVSDQGIVYLFHSSAGNNQDKIYRSAYPVLNNKSSNNNDQLTVFPNPATSRINLRGCPLKPENYIIYDIHGRTALRGLLCSDEIDVSGLKCGIYLIQVNFIGGFQNCKFVVK